MLRISMVLLGLLLLVPVTAKAQAEGQREGAETTAAGPGGRETAAPETSAAGPGAGQEVKELSGMSIVGNDEVPKALYIVPWKSSEIGVETSLEMLLDESAVPVDREVFTRQLEFYELRTEAPTATQQVAKQVDIK